MTWLEVLGIVLLVLVGLASLYWFFYINITVVEQSKDIELLQDRCSKTWLEQIKLNNKLAEKQDKKIGNHES